MSGPHRAHFGIKTALPFPLDNGPEHVLKLSFRPRSMGVCRVNVTMFFVNGKDCTTFSILCSLLLRPGDADMYDALKPVSPYVKKKQRKKDKKPTKEENIVSPPKNQAGTCLYKNLPSYRVPKDIRAVVETRDMEEALVPPTSTANDFNADYTIFWQYLLWVNELQAYEDI